MNAHRYKPDMRSVSQRQWIFQTYDASFYTVGCKSMAKSGYPLLELTVSLHYLRSTLACSKTQSEHVKIRCHVIVMQ